MPSPFPGMDPYLEQDVIWHDFHERFLPAAAAQLSSQVLPRYIVLIDEHVYLQDGESGARFPIGRPDLTVSERGGTQPIEPRGNLGVIVAPARVRVPELDEEREAFLTIRDRLSRQIVSVIELLSPTNKRTGENRRRYLAKRADVLKSDVNFIEIDLLRSGRPMPAENRPLCTYSVLISNPDERPDAGFWPIDIRDPLPVIPIPLRAGEPVAHLDLRAIIDRVYDEAGYRYYLYATPPDPPLSTSDFEWASARVAAL